MPKVPKINVFCLFYLSEDRFQLFRFIRHISGRLILDTSQGLRPEWNIGMMKQGEIGFGILIFWVNGNIGLDNKN